MTAVTRPGARSSVAVLRALGLGDLLTAVPALRGLRRHHGSLTLAAPAGLEPLARATGAVDEVVDVDFTSQAPTELPARLRGTPTAVNLHGRGPGSHRALQRVEPRELLAFRFPGVHEHGPPWRDDEHEVDRWCRLLRWSGIACDPADLTLAVPPLDGWPAAGGPVAVLHPGASSPARQWPATRWAEVARACGLAGLRPVLTGSPPEAPLAAHVADLAAPTRCEVAAGATSLWTLARLVAAADVVISGDTGVAHLATALRRRSVLLFGPTPPRRWGPRIDGDRHVVLWAGRHGDPHGGEPDPGLMAIHTTEVVRGLHGLLGRRGDV